MTESTELTKQQFLEKVLIIKHDEKNQYFTETSPIVNEWFVKIQETTPNLIIVCTQNSKSGTENHFQHWLGKKIMKFKTNESLYFLLSKVDATRISNSSSLLSLTKSLIMSEHEYIIIHIRLLKDLLIKNYQKKFI